MDQIRDISGMHLQVIGVDRIACLMQGVGGIEVGARGKPMDAGSTPLLVAAVDVGLPAP